MSRYASRTETEAVNPDSFLDIVASVVSIMIIMVLMIGLRIKHAPADVPLTIAASPEAVELTRDQTAEQTLRADVLHTAEEIRALQNQAFVQKQNRDLLAVTVSAMEHRIAAGRQQLSAQSQQDFDARRSLAEAKARLTELQQRRVAVESAPAAPVIVESYPTPISRAVNGHEIHFQLLGNRVTLIPIESLLERFKSDARQQAHKLLDTPEVTETVGPEDGWRLRYTLERVDATAQSARGTARSGSYGRLALCTLIPVSSQLGEPLEEALAPGAQFRAALAGQRPEQTTVTLWVYPDSFDAFRQMRKELYRLGFPIAARPLPPNTPIGMSPEGSNSAAE